MRIRYMIEVYKKQGQATPGTYTYETTPSLTITDGLSFDCDKSIETNTDGFSFVLQNERDSNGLWRFRNQIKVDDRIAIYITAVEDITSSNKNSYKRYDGIVTEVGYDSSDSGRNINIKGESRLDRMLNFTYPAAYEDRGAFTSTASNIIQDLLEAVNDENSNYQITWDSGNDTTSTSIQYYRQYRPVIELVEELSKQKINQEFNAMYYLDSDNNFIWKEKTKNSSITLQEGTDFFKYRYVEKVRDVINAMIVDCGVDPSNRSIHAMYYDEESAGEYGLKWSNTIETQSEIASSLITESQKLAAWINSGDENRQQFPNTSAYPMTLGFKERNTYGNPGGTSVVVSSDGEWVTAIRTEAKWQGVDWIKAVIDLTGHVRPNIDIDMCGADWELGAGRTGTSAENCLDENANPILQGDMVNIILESKGGDFSTGKKLRCMQVNHEFGVKGWITTTRFEMDIDDAKDYFPSGHEA